MNSLVEISIEDLQKCKDPPLLNCFNSFLATIVKDIQFLLGQRPLTISFHHPSPFTITLSFLCIAKLISLGQKPTRGYMNSTPNNLRELNTEARGGGNPPRHPLPPFIAVPQQLSE